MLIILESIILILSTAGLAFAGQEPHGRTLAVDFRGLVSRADISYGKLPMRSEEGLPIGNGRMGTLLWATPTSLRMQINRVDVFANGCATNSFPERHTDYCGGCGFVDIDLAEFGDDVFPRDHTMQHLCFAKCDLEVKQECNLTSSRRLTNSRSARAWPESSSRIRQRELRCNSRDLIAVSTDSLPVLPPTDRNSLIISMYPFNEDVME